MKKATKILSVLLLLLVLVIYLTGKVNLNPFRSVGEPIDNLNGVEVYYNGGIRNIEERNVVNGYNLGLKYQCVEFVKRYYYQHYNHKMPDTYGNVKDFFNPNVKDGNLNTQRNLKQYSNPSSSVPNIGDLIVMSETSFNQFGHVAIISKVTENEIEIIQQNPGPFSSSREVFGLLKEGMNWKIDSDRILGWLRK